MPKPYFCSFILLVTSLLLTACGSVSSKPGHWVNPNLSQMAIKLNHDVCIKQAWESYPWKYGMISLENGYTEPAKLATSDCRYSEISKSTSCTYYPAVPQREVPAEMVKGDENIKLRATAYAACMVDMDKNYKCIKGGREVSGMYCGQYQEP